MTQARKKTLNQVLETQYIEASGNSTRDNTIIYALYQTARSSLSREERYSFLNEIEARGNLDDAEKLFLNQSREYILGSKVSNKPVDYAKIDSTRARLLKLLNMQYSILPLEEKVAVEQHVPQITPAVVIADQPIYSNTAKEAPRSWRSKLAQAAFTFGALAAVTVGSFMLIPNHSKQEKNEDNQTVAALVEYAPKTSKITSQKLPSGSAVIALDKGELEAVVADHNRLGLTGPVKLPLLGEPKLPAKSSFVGTWSEYFRELNESKGKPVIFPKVLKFWEELETRVKSGANYLMSNGRDTYSNLPIKTHDEFIEGLIENSRAKGEGFMVIGEKGKEDLLLRFGNSKN